MPSIARYTPRSGDGPATLEKHASSIPVDSPRTNPTRSRTRRPEGVALRRSLACLALAYLLLLFGAPTSSAGAQTGPQIGDFAGNLVAFDVPQPIAGTAAYSFRIESAAQVRGLELAGRQGCAVLNCSLIGREAWIHVGGQWNGPLLVVDCTAAHHRPLWITWGRAVDIPWSLWQALDLPLMPVPALVTFDEPPAYIWN